MKKLCCILLCMVIVLSLSVSAFADKRISNVNDVWAIGEGAEPDIYEAVLYADGSTPRRVYCVVCDGMRLGSFDPNDALSLTNAVKLSFSCENNEYVKTVSSAVLNTVPEGADLVFLGRSMGGMAVQQVIAQSEIKAKYNVLHSLAVGSPYIITSQRKEGEVRRCVDRLDIVPYLSISGLANPYIGDVGRETSFVFPNLHMEGYLKGSCWKSYDCLGVKNGSAYIDLGAKVFG